MKNELLTIGPFTIYGYGLMIAIGIVAGCLTAEYRARKQGLDSEQIFPMILWCLVGGFLCAKLLFWITEWKSIAQDPGFMMETLSSGFVVFGGIIGGILTGFLYCRIKGLIFFKYADVILPSVALAQGFGRIGCFLAGCCYGKETESVFSVIFQNSEYAPNHVALIPTQLYSSGLDFLHFLLLLLIARNKKEDGQVTACYLIFYSIGRFVIEFFRGDIIRGSVGILSTSQFISIFTGIAGIVLLIRIRKKRDSKSSV
jgi:phosphatidylglycerol:prolipoprotein diacylglycerol transferase